jgi:malonate-semialdehyde dehydrogenase (acetylating)/methylmalonate-semialdehyde dehydrogenase
VVPSGTRPLPDHGYFVAPTLIDRVEPGTRLFQEEIFGPVLSLVRTESLDQAVSIMNTLAFGNGASIFTASGGAARQFSREIQCGMLGINVGVPAPMALFSFSGWNRSFFGDLHVQGMEGVLFYTRQKVILSRWDSAYLRHQGW